MKQMSEQDPGIIAKRTLSVEAELGDQLASCERRRVTEGTMGCVRGASTFEELETCLK